MDKSDVAVFAKTDFRGEGRRFGIKTDDRRRHMYLIGKTGVGKSTLIENLVYNDINEGRGVCLIDPHGDSVELILSAIPSHRINDVVYINPSDLDYPVAFNVLEKVDPKYRHVVASGVVGVFKKLWAESWGPRLEYLLRNSVLALLDYPESTLLGVNRILIDKDFRKKVLVHVNDPVVKTFWLDEYTKYNQAFMTEAIAPIQNKVGQFLSTSLIRNIVGQVHSTIDMRKIMDEEKILLVNLSKGRIGEDASAMLGAMIITKIQLAAMSRVDILESTRKDFYLYVDEFQNFATEAFAGILSEARKYRLNLIIAHQYIEQLEEAVSAAIFGNVGTLVVYRVGGADAAVLIKEFEPTFLEEDLVNLPKFHVYLKLMIDGVASEPFSAMILPPVAREAGTEEKVVNSSRERYSNARQDVEDAISRWAGVETEEMLERMEAEQEARKGAKVTEKRIDFLASFNGDLHKEESEAETETQIEAPGTPTASSVKVSVGNDEQAEVEEYFFVPCSSCKQKTKLNFKPDGVRPVFCKECLKDHRRDSAKKENRENARKERAASHASSRPTPTAPIRETEPVEKEIAPAISLTEAMSKGASTFSGKPKRTSSRISGKTLAKMKDESPVELSRPATRTKPPARQETKAPAPPKEEGPSALEQDIANSYNDITSAPKDIDEEIAVEDLDTTITP